MQKTGKPGFDGHGLCQFHCNRLRFGIFIMGLRASGRQACIVQRIPTSRRRELAVIGPGSGRIGPITRNTDLFHLMVEVAGVEAFAEA